MAGARQPTDLVVRNGRKHLTRAEEDARRDREVVVPAPQRAKPPKWLLDKRWAKLSICIMRIWQMSGYYMVMFLTGLQTISPTLYEAACIDGANKRQQLLYITIPMLSPTTFAIVILLVLEAFNIFEAVMIMTSGGLNTSSLMYYVYTLAFTNYRMGYASALAWILFLIILIFTILRFVLKKDESM